jgi:hypothetical protein
LLLIGRLHDVGPHSFHQRADLETGRGHVPEQGGGERAVAAGAVEGDVVGLRGIGDHSADGALDDRKSLTHVG